MSFVKNISLLIFAIVAGLALSLSFLSSLSPFWAWISAANLVAFFTYSYDKLAAGLHWLRIPEISLLALALLGGSPAAAVAMQLFRHKTAKREFQTRFWLIVGVQALAYFAWRLGLFG